ncbi:hypothetical protein [Streptomyces antimycoticus]|uniref:hypothetical protein n=1 Tax=Streptomyces antimycoticus TaxID=68175 RepID=UPI0036ECEA67
MPPGEPGKCYTEAASWGLASGGELAYVEGLAWDLAWPVEHAWCAGPDGNARDLTWPRLGRAYLGLTVHAEEAVRIMSKSGPLLHGNGFASDVAITWCREGVPAELLVDIGRPVPAAD